LGVCCTTGALRKFWLIPAHVQGLIDALSTREDDEDINNFDETRVIMRNTSTLWVGPFSDMVGGAAAFGWAIVDDDDRIRPTSCDLPLGIKPSYVIYLSQENQMTRNRSSGSFWLLVFGCPRACFCASA
jgi:hypothetical protein